MTVVILAGNEMLSSTMISVKSVKMNIVHVNIKSGALCFLKVGEWVTQRVTVLLNVMRFSAVSICKWLEMFMSFSN